MNNPSFRPANTWQPVLHSADVCKLLATAKPCPKCHAGSGKLFMMQNLGKVGITYRVECGECAHFGPEANLQSDAVNFWNWTRP